MPNFPTDPPRPVWNAPVAVYHALPHGLRDGLGQIVGPDAFVDLAATLGAKREMLARHRSQKEWLDASQGIGAYLAEMESMAREVGGMSGRFEFAEGWRRHSRLGFGPPDFNPLKDLAKGNYHEPTHQ
jgi:LmbE family N-acetylglucosaminyl deacetylase